MDDRVEYRGQFVTPAVILPLALIVMVGAVEASRPHVNWPASIGLVVTAILWLVLSIRSAAAKRIVLSANGMTFEKMRLPQVKVEWSEIVGVYAPTSDEGEVGALGAVVLQLRDNEGFLRRLTPLQRKYLNPSNNPAKGILIYVFLFNVPRDRLAREICQRANLPGPSAS
jgi:hypothetical protein